LQEIIDLCKNWIVLFDNKTKDESKRVEQVEQLLSLVNLVVAQNGGRRNLFKQIVQSMLVQVQVKGKNVFSLHSATVHSTSSIPNPFIKQPLIERGIIEIVQLIMLIFE
jgi:high-affinity Fe2+/Pb2+ permease